MIDRLLNNAGKRHCWRNWDKENAGLTPEITIAAAFKVFEIIGDSVISNFMETAKLKETDLYPAVKTLLETQGYEVKGEIGAIDIVAMKDGGPPLIVELKTGFSLSLFHQAVERQAISDIIYIAVPYLTGRQFQTSLKRNTSLCRRLGLGLLTVRLKDQLVQIHCDPVPYQPRKSKEKTARLLKEFAKRVGDPNRGGATRQGLMTAYRQDALRCARVLVENGPSKAAHVARLAPTERARPIMADDHYGWFEKITRGVYSITPRGIEAVSNHAGELQRIAELKPDKK